MGGEFPKVNGVNQYGLVRFAIRSLAPNEQGPQAVTAPTLTGVSPSSLAVARAGYLAEHGLLHDARLVVLAALARDPDEPVLHTLLGSLYNQVGLLAQAAEAFDEAESLLTRTK